VLVTGFIDPKSTASAAMFLTVGESGSESMVCTPSTRSGVRLDKTNLAKP
jgi:hypothetical protein